MQSCAIECNHLEREEDGSDGDTHRDPIAERDHLWERDGAPWWALACAQPRLTGIQLPSAITCGRGMVRRGGHLHARSRDSQGSLRWDLESAMYPEHSSGGVGEERANLGDLLTAGDTGSSALDGIGEGAHAALYVGLEV